jgi:hypothetical protein
MKFCFNNKIYTFIATNLLATFILATVIAQKEYVQVVHYKSGKSIDINIGGKPFASFLYPELLEKPVLTGIHTANGTTITRGYPLNTQPGDPTDHPHHIGLWLNFENVNGLDFWNNSSAIAADKKHLYGWIKTDRIEKISSGNIGKLIYHANWTNIKNTILAEETTSYFFSGTAHQRIIDRITTITADTVLLFTDAKDGLLGLRLAHALQIPTDKDQKFTDDKGNVTLVKGGTDSIPNGNYVSSTGKYGDSVWSTRAGWCKVFGKMGSDSVSVTIIDHPANINYPTFWHARGYGLFAANPLGEKIFTNNKSAKNLQLKKGESVIFRYRIVIDDGKQTTGTAEINKLAEDFSKTK